MSDSPVKFGDMKEAGRQFDIEWELSGGNKLTESDRTLCRTMWLLAWVASAERFMEAGIQMTPQQQLAAEADKSFERNLMATHIGRLDSETLEVCRKCYRLGFINGGDHVLSQVQAVQFS